MAPPKERADNVAKPHLVGSIEAVPSVERDKAELVPKRVSLVPKVAVEILDEEMDTLPKESKAPVKVP